MANIKWFNEISLSDINIVGGKNASLGEMIQNLTNIGVDVPYGFAITTNCFKQYMKDNNLNDAIINIIASINFDSIEDVKTKSFEIRKKITEGYLSQNITNEILVSYDTLSQLYMDVNGTPETNIDVAVRSSGTAEDLPDASFAGQQDTYLNVHGHEEIISSIKSCFASLYTDRAIAYRHAINYSQYDISISVGIQKMIRSDIGSSGVAFSIDTESGFKDIVLINGSYGLGELVVQGSVKPDEFIVFKPMLNNGFDSIIDKKLGAKINKMIYSENIKEKTKIVPVSNEEQGVFCMTDEQIIQLSKWVCLIEKHYTNIRGTYTPMDTEWALDGNTGKLYIVQARPETVVSKKDHSKITEYKLPNHNKTPLLTGIAVGDLVSSGNVKIIMSLDEMYDRGENVFKKGDILVTDMTDPDWEPLMKLSSGIITNKGGRTCHSAIVARELGIAAIVGTGNVTDILHNGDEVTISCAEGETGYVYPSHIPYETNIINVSALPLPKTKIMLNVGSPDNVFKTSFLPHRGVGLAREEFIINHFIGIHPLAILNYNNLNTELKVAIDKKILGFSDPISYYVNKLSYGVGRIGAAFYPQDVIVRFSDFKSNEYKNLLGGADYEPNEENPMIGWRGASRYYSKAFEKAFGLECTAIANVRNNLGLTNVIVMVPFCRTPLEMKNVLEVMKKYGLERGVNGLKVYIMCELPSNVILAEEFSEYVDGFSIGSNDLTQLTLGLDRDSHLVSHVYDERSPAVKKMISDVIKVAKKNNKKIGICGQGPSDFPDFAQFLVEQEIDSISITPDSFVKTVVAINKING